MWRFIEEFIERKLCNLSYLSSKDNGATVSDWNGVEILSKESERPQITEALDWLTSCSPDLKQVICQNLKFIHCSKRTDSSVLPAIGACIINTNEWSNLSVSQLGSRFANVGRYINQCNACGRYKIFRFTDFPIFKKETS